MQTAIETLIEAIKIDYANYNGASNEIRKRMIAEFNKSITYTVGKKYIRVVKGGSVWGFIVKEDDIKFRKGDILKAAGWATPAKNFSRGNIFEGGYSISWTGP